GATPRGHLHLVGSDAGDHLPAGLAVHLVLVLPTQAGEEPVQSGAAVQRVSRVIIEDCRAAEEVRAVQTPAETAVELADAGGVTAVGAIPPGQDVRQGRQVAVVAGGAADEDIAGAAGVQLVGPGAADQQVGGAAAVEGIVAGAALQDAADPQGAGVE